MRSLALVAAFALGCGGSSPPPATPAPAPSSEPEPSSPKGEIRGSLAPVEVKKALVARKDDVHACYHALLEKNKKASGKVVIEFVVAEDGTVESTTIMNATTLPNDTAKCIADVVKSTTFPKPDGGKARITYPWEFTAE